MSCASIAFLLTAWTVTDLLLPIHIDVAPGLAIANLSLSKLELGQSLITYDASVTMLELKAPTSISGSITVVVNKSTAFELNMGLMLTAGQVEIDTVRQQGASCLTESATLRNGNCSVTPLITSISITPPDAKVDWLLNVTAFVIDLFHDSICTGVANSLIQLLTNHSFVPPNPPPTPALGSTPLVDAALFAGVVNIVNSLPVLLGLDLRAEFISANTIELDIGLANGINISGVGSSFSSQRMIPPRFFKAFPSLLSSTELSSSLLQLIIPPQTTLKLQLVVNDLMCTNRLTCTIPVKSPVKVLNIRLSGDGEFDRIVDVLVGKLIEDLINLLLTSPSTSSSAADDMTITIAIPDKPDSQIPPLHFILPFGLLLLSFAVGVVVYSARRHKKYPVFDAQKNKVPTIRVVLEDTFVCFVCFGCIFLFAWSNSTTGGEVLIGGEFRLYSFGLVNTVHDLWHAGLQPLSFFVCLFSGVYPYFKLLAIVLFSVVLQRPQSRILRAIDALGKFSLLDTFVMMILVGGLEVKGIADVHMQASFYIFVTATVLSILVGNYATHGWRHETSTKLEAVAGGALLSSASLQEGQQQHKLPVAFGDASPLLSNNTNDDIMIATPGSPMSPASPAQVKTIVSVRWKVAVPSTILVLTCCVIYSTQPLLQYHITGLAVMVTGSGKSMTLFDMFRPCGNYVTATSVFTLVVAPVLYTVTFPGCRFLGAWCAMDAFLLGCVAGLFQLEQFIVFVLGDNVQWAYSASATLMWPLYLMCCAMLVVWAMLTADLFRIRC